MADRDEIIGFLDDLLDAGGFDDYGPNGLQVPGAAAVTTVATGVSAHLELFAAAHAAGAELVLAHHGLFWEFHPRALSPQMAERLKLLLANGISLAAYHLPLDAHPEVGNNALIADGLGCASREPFAEHPRRLVDCCRLQPRQDGRDHRHFHGLERLDRQPRRIRRSHRAVERIPRDCEGNDLHGGDHLALHHRA